jgi:hypothetical protein
MYGRNVLTRTDTSIVLVERIGSWFKRWGIGAVVFILVLIADDIARELLSLVGIHHEVLTWAITIVIVVLSAILFVDTRNVGLRRDVSDPVDQNHDTPHE